MASKLGYVTLLKREFGRGTDFICKYEDEEKIKTLERGPI